MAVTSSSKSKDSETPCSPEKEAANDDNANEQSPSNEEENTTENNEDEENKGKEKEEEETLKANSVLLKCYGVLVASCAINMVAAVQSDGGNSNWYVEEDDESRRVYAMAAAGITGGFSVVCLIAHYDRFSCLQRIWKKLFGPKKCFEKYLLYLLVIYNAVTIWINTTVTGIAGDAKRQYNLYFSTWLSFISVIWALERWFVASGHSSMEKFLNSWPFRAPGWLVHFVTALANFLFVLDLYLHWDDESSDRPAFLLMFSEVQDYEWAIVLLASSASFVAAFGFTAVELFRYNRVGVEPRKATWETHGEGFVLLILCALWLVSVGIATTPGGLASYLGNSYFFTWANVIIEINIFLWWIRDWRRDIRDAIEKQHSEYRKAQEAVLAQREDEMEEGGAAPKRSPAIEGRCISILVSSAPRRKGQPLVHPNNPNTTSST